MAEVDLAHPRSALGDPWLRSALLGHLAPDGFGSRVRHEVEIRWSVPVRVDVLAVIGEDPLAPSGSRGGLLEAFEIKSDVDSLARLPRQVAGYEQIAQRCWVVTGRRHHAGAVLMLPGHWGVIVADGSGTLVVDRVAAENPRLNLLAAMSLVVDITELRWLVRCADLTLASTAGMRVDDLRAHFVEHADPGWVMEVVRRHAVPRNLGQGRTVAPAPWREVVAGMEGPGA